MQYQHEVTSDSNVGTGNKQGQQNIREIVQQIVKKAQEAMKRREVSAYDLSGLSYNFDVTSGVTGPLSADHERTLELDEAA